RCYGASGQAARQRRQSSASAGELSSEAFRFRHRPPSVPPMTRSRPPIEVVPVSAWRRRGGSGEPAPHPVPPPVNPIRPWLLDSRAVAQLLGIGRTAPYQLMLRGELPTVRLGRCVRVSAPALAAWITEQSTSHRSQCPRTRV